MALLPKVLCLLLQAKKRNKACLNLQKPELAVFIIQQPMYGPSVSSPAGQTGQQPPGSWFVCSHHYQDFSISKDGKGHSSRILLRWQASVKVT